MCEVENRYWPLSSADQSAERGGEWVSACWWGRRITPFAVFIVGDGVCLFSDGCVGMGA